MRQPALILTILFSTILCRAETITEVTRIYSDYKIKRTQFYSADLNKKNLAIKLKEYSSTISSALDKVKAIEAKTPKHPVTTEGNQLAVDIELLMPLEELAKSSFSKESCSFAENLNELNTGQEQELYSEIDKIIKKVCN